MIFKNIKTAEQLTAEKDEADATQARNSYKARRAELVNSIKITTASGNQFDGDEVAQGRMSRSILGLPDDVTTIKWVLATGVAVPVNKPELKEALTLAGSEQARLWTLTTEQQALEV